MIGRLVLAALIAGLVAGLILAGIQHVRLSPLIAEAEVYEHSHDHVAAETAEAVPCVETMPGMKMCSETGTANWEPADGGERSLYTSLASLLAGAGFAAMLAGVSFLSGIPITSRNGLIWGLCGFIAVAIAPAAGLPPELPGMPVADLHARQFWWVSTIMATGLGIYLIAIKRSLPAAAAAIVIIALPHLIGAPVAATHESALPPALASAFAANALAAAAVFWCVLGQLLGIALERISYEQAAA